MRLRDAAREEVSGMRQACWLETHRHPWNVLAVAVYGSTRSGCRRSAIPLTSPFTNTRIRCSAQVASLRAARQPPGFIQPPFTPQSP
jgi:hypothetical protein